MSWIRSMCFTGLLFAHAVNGPSCLWGQDDLDSLDHWIRTMHPDPFIRCGEDAWARALDATREQWLDANHLEKVRLCNGLLMTMQDSHTSVSSWHWVIDVEREYGTLAIRWAIEGRALWVLDSGHPALPEEVRVLELNGIPAEEIIEAVLDLGTAEGLSPNSTARAAAHVITPWTLAKTKSQRLEISWIDPSTGLVEQGTLTAQPWRKAKSKWASISTRRPVIDWTFPDGTHLTPRDSRWAASEEERLRDAGHEKRVNTHWNGASTLKITSFSEGFWGRYHRRLKKGFEVAKTWSCPVVVDLRGNPGGQSPRMEALWMAIAKTNRHLPYALVAKQSELTASINGRHYKRWKKRWVDRHLDSSPEARYIHALATLPVGETDTLHFPIKRARLNHSFQGQVAVLIDGESASASVSFAGAVQADARGILIGESCMGPKNGTMGNPYLKVLPVSGIVVSISTAVYMAEPCSDWAASRPIQPDVLVPSMWRRDGRLDQAVTRWIQHFRP